MLLLNSRQGEKDFFWFINYVYCVIKCNFLVLFPKTKKHNVTGCWAELNQRRRACKCICLPRKKENF